MTIQLMEPNSYGKRRRYSNLLMDSKRNPQPSIEEIKQKLKDIREYSIAHQDILLTKLIAGATINPDVELTFAQDARQAVDIIRGIIGDGAKIAINKSSVIVKELMPSLTSYGYELIESYYNDIDPFEARFNEYWQLPAIPYESLYNSFESPIDQTKRRASSLRKNGAKDFVGLLGVNAVSADEGKMLLLQHRDNIGKIIDQARELILVVGTDKIVKSLDDAIFQTKCMAIFGSEALPLTLRGRGKQENSSIDELPCEIPPEQVSSKIHLIVLDNGRSHVMESSYKELLTCIDCRACTKGCPGSKYFADGTRWSPREYIYYYITGNYPSLKSCLQCKSCELNCPLNIEIPDMILDAKAKSFSWLSSSPADILLANAEKIFILGSKTASLTNLALNFKPLRWVGKKTLNFGSKIKIPTIQHDTFAKWFESRNNKEDL